MECIGRILTKYKQVREDIVGRDPILAGAVGTTPEIHEQISQRTGKGAVVLFATTNGRFKYIAAHRPSKNFWLEGEVSVHFDAKHHAVVEATFTSPSAVIVLFGTEDVAQRDE